ncbi:MAG: NAD(P)/FAD-dependent oxidoreductase [Anaerolineaceae bacterium]
MNEVKEYDVIIIGGGVIGCMLARYLSRYTLDILLIEKESDIGSGTSAANTAIVHPGYDAIPGSLKAKVNVAANPMWDDLAGELQFAFQRHGDYVVAIGEDELTLLDILMQRGKQNGVLGMQFISADSMRSREPNINPAVSGALWATTGGVCDPFGVTIAAAENAVSNGVTILRETAFENFIWNGKRITGIKTNRGTFTCRWVVNAAGLFSDTIMHQAGVRPDFKITPRKGEYFVLDRTQFTVNNVLFPVPSENSKGILVTTTVHGNTILGPNAQNIKDKEDKENTIEGMHEVFEGAKKLVPSVDTRHIIAIFAGLRASGNANFRDDANGPVDDFIVEIPEIVQGFINLGGIESPGLTAAPAIAQYVVELLKDAGEKLLEKQVWNPVRPARPQFRHLTYEERDALIKKDARYGRVVCRCENVTEGEIVAEIHSPIPALTYDAIKRRTWLGTGRCQGGFDMPRVTEILARELGVSQLEISKKNGASKLLCRPTKEDGGAQ